MRLGSVLVVTTVMLSTACSDGSDTDGQASALTADGAASLSSVAPLSPVRISDATYHRTLSRADARAAGFDSVIVDEVIGDRDVVQFTVMFDGPKYSQYQRNDDGPARLGDRGLQYVDEDGHLVLVSENIAVSGGAAVLDWTMTGDELTTTCVAGCLRDFAPDANMVWEGTWTATG